MEECPRPSYPQHLAGQALSVGRSGTALPVLSQASKCRRALQYQGRPRKRRSPRARRWEPVPEDAPGNWGTLLSPSCPLASALCPFRPLPGCNSASPLGGSTGSTCPHLFSQSANFY